LVQFHVYFLFFNCVFFSVIPVATGYILLKGLLIMMGMTIGLAPALLVGGAAEAKQRGGTCLETRLR
jgi:hypothetical protein